MGTAVRFWTPARIRSYESSAMLQDVENLRYLPLVDRKHRLREVNPRDSREPPFYSDKVEEIGESVNFVVPKHPSERLFQPGRTLCDWRNTLSARLDGRREDSDDSIPLQRKFWSATDMLAKTDRQAESQAMKRRAKSSVGGLRSSFVPILQGRSAAFSV
jgi:hypothetical protein